MKKFAILLAAGATLAASAAFADDLSAPANPQPAAAQTSASPAATSSNDAAQPAESGQLSRNLCSKADPYIEYRDCVNASTRNANAKVRMA